MASLPPLLSIPPRRAQVDLESEDDTDTASQRSISLSSPPKSRRHSRSGSDAFYKALVSPIEDTPTRESHSHIVNADLSLEANDQGVYTTELESRKSLDSSTAPSVYDEPKTNLQPTYPPTQSMLERESVASFSSGSSYSRKERPESMLLIPPDGPLVLGIALVDFNHMVGPRIEYCKGAIFDDDEIVKILPFLALPDGAHLSVEDYSYFHLVPSCPNPTTVFGISCNRQISSSTLLVKDPEVTRSIVQKAVVVLASKPVFGPIRDKLGVVTRALFNQRDFSETDILDEFSTSLELSLRGQLTESGLYMGTSLRELVHTFRQRTLILVKALLLQKRIMFYGHPVERLCTYQYSLISLLPGLLQTLDDCGSPPLASRAPTLSRPTSLRTSDRKSMMAYMGLPLDIFGKDAFFQPYLPLQQLDIAKETKTFLCGSTNSIVTQQKEIDLLVDTETGAFEFRDPKLERSAGLTSADRKWMDDIVKDVNDGWSDDEPSRPLVMHFKGSDDYLRIKFEEYVSAALASVKYRDFVGKGERSGVMITGGSGGDVNSVEDFNPLWIMEFKRTNAYEVWERTTDPLLFDIVEPRHPCNEKPSVVADIGLRLQEGLQELKLEQQLAPTREAITRTLSAGQSNFFKAVEGVRGRWGLRTASSSSTSIDSLSSTPPVEISKADAQAGVDVIAEVVPLPPSTPSRQSTLESGTVPTEKTLTAFAGWGAGIGSLLSSAGGRFTIPMMGKPVEAEFATSTSALRSTTVPSPPASPNTPRADGFKAFKLIAQPPPARKVVEGYTNPHPSYVHEEDMYPSEEPAGVAL